VVPLFPHYAMSSYETATEYMKKIYAENHYHFALKIVSPYYANAGYIAALAKSMKPFLQTDFDQILFSYHGIPLRHLYKSDATHGKHFLNSAEKCCENIAAQATCYRHQVLTTTRLVTEKLGLKKNQWQLSFQSRLGKDTWLKPATHQRLAQLPREGIKNLLVVCPSFVCDCLETLEEINVRGRNIFLQNGGKNFILIPCLNANEYWVKALAQLINEVP
jgi:ferrochelatase